jgi:hypothetical protein
MNLFEVDSDLKCRYAHSIEKSDLVEGNFYIERVFDRKSSTGATDYNIHKVFDHNMMPAKIIRGCAKLVAISTDYWWSLGSFSQEEERMFVPGNREFEVYNKYPTFKTGPRICMYANYINWLVNRTQFGHKCCLLAVEDEEGTIARIPSFFSGSDEIQQSLMYLSLVNDFKFHVTAKLYWILLQLSGMSIELTADKDRAKQYLETIIKPLYNSSLNINPNAHKADSDISDMYNSLLQRIY